MARVKCPHCFHVNPDRQDNCEKCGAGLPRISIEARPGQNQGPPPQQPGRSQLQFRRGQVVAGRYTVLNLIGQGGMGSIYKVHDNTLGEDVALKTLLPQFLEDKVVLERFYNEAKIARRLAHPNIVRVHDIGEDGKILYISMEYLQGMSLREMLDNLRPGERLPINQTLRVFDQLCSALEYAHQFTVHRDIKPENVMLGQDGAVRLMDFGISKLMANTRLTNASIVMGTPFYMSPEQIRNSRDVDKRADIYSVGVMLYEILTGSVPTGVPKPASEITKDVPPSLDKIVTKCVEPDPRERYQSAAELRQALQPIMRQIQQSGISGSKTSLIRVRRGDYSLKKMAGAVVMAAILLLSGWGLYAAEQHRRGLAVAPPSNNGNAMSTPAAGGAAVAPTMDAYASLMEELVPAAEARGGDRLNGALAQGALHWANALREAGANEQAALGAARLAVQCYLAPLLRPQGMVFVPPGTTIAGGANVAVPAFFIDQYEVTVAEYQRFADVESIWSIPPELEGADDRPISDVTCIDAMAFAAWRGVSLPTEGQWARAAAGENTQANFPWDEEPTSEFCNAMVGDDSVPRASMPVGSFEKDLSPFGCYDMFGNVSEWTRTAEPGLAKGEMPGFGTKMVTKGGHAGMQLRSWTYRFPFAMDQRGVNLGFRCVQNIPDDPAGARAILRSRS